MLPHRRHTIISWLFLAMVLLNLFPLWAWKYFPSQDGPAHLYNSFVLAHYAATPLFQQYFQLHWSPAGNALSHVLLAGLLLVFSPLLSQRILLTMYCITLPFAFRYAAGAWKRSDPAMSFAAFLLVYNSFLHLGFWNFCFSVALFLVSFGYLVRHAGPITWRSGAVMLVLVFATYSAHIASWIILVIGAGVLFLNSLLKHERDRLPWLGVVTLLPGIFAAVYAFEAGHNVTTGSLSLRDRLWPLYGVSFLRGYTFAETDLARIVVACAIGLLALTALKQRHVLWSVPLLLCVICTVLTPILPPNGNFLQARLAFYAFLFLLLGVAAYADFGRAAPAIQALLICLSLAGLILRVQPYRHWNQVLSEYTQAAGHITPNCTLLPVRYAADQDGGLRPTLHAADLFVPKTFIDFYDYEAAYDYFPVLFQPGLSPVRTLGWTDDFDRFPPVFHLDRYQQATGAKVDFILVEIGEDQADPWPERKYSAASLANYQLVYVSQPHATVHLYRRIAP